MPIRAEPAHLNCRGHPDLPLQEPHPMVYCVSEFWYIAYAVMATPSTAPLESIARWKAARHFPVTLRDMQRNAQRGDLGEIEGGKLLLNKGNTNSTVEVIVDIPDLRRKLETADPHCDSYSTERPCGFVPRQNRLNPDNAHGSRC